MTTKVPVELSSTPGIVDGSNATAITIDSNENSTFAGNITIPADGTIASASGDITLDAPDDIFLDADGGNIRFKDAGTTHYHFSNGGNSLGHIFFADSGSNEGSMDFTFQTDGSAAGHSITNIIMRQGSGDGGSRKGEMLFQVSDNGAPATAMTIANNKAVTTASYLLATGGVYISAFDGDKRITDASQGGGSDALFIGNAQIQVSSDERIKKDIVDTAINATEKLKEVRVVDFTWDDPKDQSYNNKNARGQWTGAIAQELISVFPHIINAPRDKETLEVDNDSERKWLVEYENLVPILIKSIQELEARIKTLEDA